jgi:hypothetical protein
VIFAAPLVAMLSQIALIGVAIQDNSDHSKANSHYGTTLFYAGMAVTLLAVPALAAAVRDARREVGRSWGFVGALLNSAYLVFMAAALATLWYTSRGTRVITEDHTLVGVSSTTSTKKP